MRKHQLVTGQTYHVYSRSIASYAIFNSQNEYSRMVDLIEYYQTCRPELRFSHFIKLSEGSRKGKSTPINPDDKLVDIIAYCIMPTHIHLVMKQLRDEGISLYMKNILNSYTRYFNTKHKRKGPLWEGRFKNVLVEDNEYLMHLTRYVHLNPATSNLVEKPEDWQYSSYAEYLGRNQASKDICRYKGVLDIVPESYKIFVEDRIAYQQELQKIKLLLLD